MPRYGLAELWSLPFDLCVDLLAAASQQQSAGQFAPAEPAKTHASGRRETPGFAALRGMIAG